MRKAFGDPVEARQVDAGEGAFDPRPVLVALDAGIDQRLGEVVERGAVARAHEDQRAGRFENVEKTRQCGAFLAATRDDELLRHVTRCGLHIEAHLAPASTREDPCSIAAAKASYAGFKASIMVLSPGLA